MQLPSKSGLNSRGGIGFKTNTQLFPENLSRWLAAILRLELQSRSTTHCTLHLQLRRWHGFCRALAYEAVGLFLAALTACSSQQTRQVQLLLESLKRSVSQPFQQLPGVIAAFAAEAVFVLMSPGCALYPPLNKLLLKRSELNLQVLPA